MKIATWAALCILLLTAGCYKAYDSIKPNEVSNYIRVTYLTGNSAAASPLAYQFLKGDNPYADYSFVTVMLINPGVGELVGDPTSLILAAYPKADLIMSFSCYFFIGTRNAQPAKGVTK